MWADSSLSRLNIISLGLFASSSSARFYGGTHFAPSPLSCPSSELWGSHRRLLFLAQRVIHAYRPSALHYYWVINGLCGNGAALMAPSVARSLLLWGGSCGWWTSIWCHVRDFSLAARFLNADWGGRKKKKVSVRQHVQKRIFFSARYKHDCVRWCYNWLRWSAFRGTSCLLASYINVSNS